LIHFYKRGMAEDLDIDALLEAPYVKQEEDRKSAARDENRRSSVRDGERKRSRSRDRRRSRSRDKKRSRSRDRKRSRSRDRKRRSRSRDRDLKRRSRSRDRDRRRGTRDRSRERRVEARLGSPPNRNRDRGDRGGDVGPGRNRGPISPIRNNGSVNTEFHIRNVRSSSPDAPLTPEERDARTVFCMQLSARCRARDLEDFMSSVGKVRDAKLIVCNKTRRFKGIAYVEFKDLESVPLAMGLSGQKLMGVPIVIQPSQAEKNRVGMSYSDPMIRPEKGPMKLYIGSLHFNITEDMLRSIFEPFGRIQTISLVKDPDTDRSKGYGFIIYNEAEDAKKAIEHLNGFELAGRPMKVGHVTEAGVPVGPNHIDTDEDRAGYDLGATGRLALMAKLAEGTGMKVPAQAAKALDVAAQNRANPMGNMVNQQLGNNMPPIATQCFMLSNMFDPATERDPNWDLEIREDVVEECNKHGGVQHIYVDKASSQGNVYVKCPSVNCAVAAVNALHGRWFAGKVITAAYVPVVNYHNLFPDSVNPAGLIQNRR